MSTATARQLDANRANAILSTGPRSDEGKLTSSRDALLPGENLDEYHDQHAEYANHFHPTNPIEVEMVTEMADLRWRLRRVPAFEAQLLSLEILSLTTDAELKPLIENLQSDSQITALAFKRLVESKVLPNLLSLESRLARRVEKIQRRLELIQQHRFDRELRKLQYRAPEAALEPIEETEEIENPENEANPNPQPIRVAHKPGRNEPCPCGSNLKFKRCCLGMTKPPLPHAEIAA
jgi:hypothetical protein